MKKNLCHVCPWPVKCFVSIFDNDFIPCSACKDLWLYGPTVFDLNS